MQETASKRVSKGAKGAKGKRKPRFLISDLCVYLESYLTPDQIREVYRAYLFGAEAHQGQRRMTGEPYIYHPLAVARILADMQMDHKCLMAAILHDVIEDTPTAKEQLAREFDQEIAELVDGVSKLDRMDFDTHAEAQAANFRKMMLAMAKDIRVILIKLADRLHNMRTLGVMRPDKRRRIARETLEIYAPIANRLGINTIRVELEELGFAALYPTRYRVLKAAVKTARGNRKAVLRTIEEAVRNRLAQESFNCLVVAREKHLYSIYCKMIEKRLPFSELVDVYALRVIVADVDSCYRVLGAVHNLYKPIPGRFKDYIAIPKTNGYQSLHTILVGPHGMPTEVQIRTEDMHRMAESGIAAHWHYKTGQGQDRVARAQEWTQRLLELQQGAGDPLEFLENVKIDLFPDEVYVFTPKGEIRVLPKGSTVVDFAYAVHSDVGNTCVAARVDRRLVPLRTVLHSGQTVEAITAPGARPNPAWLNVVVTGKARANIRNFLKNLQHKEAVILGRRLLDKRLSAYGSSLAELPQDRVEALLAEFRLNTMDQLLAEVGLGNRMPLLVARRLAGVEPGETAESPGERSEAMVVQGSEGMVVSFARCCRPIPGDPIAGVFSPGRGIVVHYQGCPNLGELRRNQEDCFEMRWADGVHAEFTSELRIEVGNQRGVLATVAAAISHMGSNIENVAIEERDGLTSTLKLVVTVEDRAHLARIMRRLRSLTPVMRLYRFRG